MVAKNVKMKRVEISENAGVFSLGDRVTDNVYDRHEGGRVLGGED